MDSGILLLLGILSAYLMLFKFLYFDTEIYLQLRNIHSKSYLRKNKAKNIFDKLFYIRYRKELSKIIFLSNIVYFISAFIGVLIILVSVMIQNSQVAETYLVYLIILSVVSVLLWITSGMLSKINTYSTVLKILYFSLYAMVCIYWLSRLILAVINYFSL